METRMIKKCTKTRQVASRIPEDIYSVLNEARGQFTMSSFIADLLATYVEVVKEETPEMIEQGA